MTEDDKNAWRHLVGQDKAPEETPEEAEAREERIASGNMQVQDLLHALPELMERTKRHNLDLYGLNDAFTEDEEQLVSASIALMSEDQRKQYWRAWEAYRNRRFRTTNPSDRTDGLLSFAATNPPDVLRKHVWRVQRGMDEPMFGEEGPTEKPNRVREYSAKVSVSLCTRCAEELERETEEAGTERTTGRGERYGNFYDRGPAMVGSFLFRYEEMFVDMESRGFLGGFPREEPKVCDRCGADDVSLWRERFGDA